MKRTLSTLFAIIAIFCLTSCSSDEEDYRITGVYETTHNDLNLPQTVINSKEELKNYIQQYLVTWESTLNKELEGDFSNYSIISYCYYTTSIKPQKIEYTEDNNNITIYCECGTSIEMALPLYYFIKVKPKIPSNAKVNLVVNGTEIPN